MRYACLLVSCLCISTSVLAGEIDTVDGLRAAISSHNSALLSGDRTRVAQTVMFPHVQFYPDGRMEVMKQESDIPNPGDEQLQWRISNTSLVSKEIDTTIVRISFERLDGTDGGAGLWCYTLNDGEWLIQWRHYLGPNANR